ncbi:MAG TPA: MerR family transcriptional regulator [Cellulomonas sp.]
MQDSDGTSSRRDPEGSGVEPDDRADRELVPEPTRRQSAAATEQADREQADREQPDLEQPDPGSEHPASGHAGPEHAAPERVGPEHEHLGHEHLGPTLTVAAVARRLGVAPATLRTWDRRYGLGPSEHAAGAHRRYSGADLARLMTMRSLTLDGVAPSEAARLARATEVGDLPDAARPDRHLVAVPDPHGAPGARTVDDDRAVVAGPWTVGPERPGRAATTAPALPPRPSRPAEPATPTAVIDAALRGDTAEVLRLLVPAAGTDLARWWSELVAPARAGIAARTVLARPGDEPDALVVAAALAVLRSRSGRVPRHPSARRIVLMLAAPGETRPLTLHVLAGALADSGVDARVVAGPTGRHRLLEIATMTSPSAVVLTSEQTVPDLDMVVALAAERPELPVYVMVPDEASELVPLGRQVHRVRSFGGLLHEVLAVCGDIPTDSRG